MPIPKITFLHLAVLGALMGGELPGRTIRQRLEAVGHHKGLASFYHLMGRLEDEGLVKGTFQSEYIDGRPSRERVYAITGDGVAAFEEASDFVRSTQTIGITTAGFAN